MSERLADIILATLIGAACGSMIGANIAIHALHWWIVVKRAAEPRS